MKSLFRLSNVGAAVLMLQACATPISQKITEIKRSQAVDKRDAVVRSLPGDAQVRGGADFADSAAQRQSKPAVLRFSSRSWVGAAMLPTNADDKLPPGFSAEYVMNFADGKNPLPLSVVSARLAQMVGIPVRIQQDVYNNPATSNATNGSTTNSETSTAASPAPAGGGTGAAAAGGGAAKSSDPGSASALAEALQAVQALPAVGAKQAAVAAPGAASGVSATGSNPPASSLMLSAASMNWRGTLIGFLNNLTDQLGLSWEYRDGAIVIMRFTTAMYEVASFPNGYNYTINSGTTGSTTGQGMSASSQLNVAEQGAINGMTSLVAVVKKMVEGVPGSEVIVSEGSGRLVVRTSRDAQASVREFIRAENANMLKQVQIQMDIYSVTTTNANELGVDWAAFYQSLSGNYGLNSSAPTTLTSLNAGAITATILPGGTSDTSRRFGNSSVVINALNQIGNNVQHRPISLIALNRQWARKARLNTTGYLSETKPSVGSALGGGTGLPGLTTSSITTGDQYAVMPFILENNTVMVKMGLSLSDLLGLFEVTTGSGDTLQRVQTPNTSAISDQYTIALKPGEVMAITGLSRDISSGDERTLGEGISLGFGGSRISSARRENFIVFIRAVIL
ncbi:hypothetical protein NQT62_01105 [Limnobacter humi]|uniref:PilN family type IVB pilus formation outer membrane protein n=1 Tax=Limnobacter humi TaxID=1778671 RepID=A0ABT1WBZ5_9BURK|nr:hypothetical protein [Limnobacter humi]MCQ8895032.1 hypothetical protein [Limnobacter humi]